jgi:hypothetical protein
VRGGGADAGAPAGDDDDLAREAALGHESSWNG